MATALLGSCVFGLLIMSGVKVAKNTQLSNAKGEIERLEKESEQYKELEETVLSLEKGLAGINAINDGSYTWTQLLPHVENATPQDIQYKSLTFEESIMTARLKGRSIDSLARFIESFKDYQVVSVSGKGVVGEKITISIDEGAESTTTVKSNGSWNHALSFDPLSDHSIKIIQNGKEISVNYSKKTKKLIIPEGHQIAATVSRLFTSVDTKQYTKEGSQVIFDANVSFSKELIW